MRITALGVRSLILITFAVFFVAPVIWLILAPTKSDQALIMSNPFSFGDFHHVALAWKHLDGFSSHIYRRWLGNTLYYALSARDHARRQRARGVRCRDREVPRPQAHPLAHARRDDRARCGARAPDLPGAQRCPSHRKRPFRDPAVRVLSVRRYLSYIYYATSIPPELLDAARVDGCGELQTFLHVALPLAKPVVALVFFFSFVADWKNFFLPYVVLANSNQYPITVGLWDLLSSTPSFNPSVGGGGQSVKIFKPELALATLVAVIPVAIVFLFSMRALVRGTLGGAVKS